MKRILLLSLIAATLCGCESKAPIVKEQVQNYVYKPTVHYVEIDTCHRLAIQNAFAAGALYGITYIDHHKHGVEIDSAMSQYWHEEQRKYPHDILVDKRVY